MPRTTKNDNSNLRPIPEFDTLKAMKHGRLWYIVDCTWHDLPAHMRTIGGWHMTYGAACFHASEQYRNVYT